MKLSKNVFYKKCCPKFLYFNYYFFRKIRTFGGSLYFKTWFYPLLIYNHKQNLTMFLPKGSQESNVCYSQMICTSNVSCWFDETIDPTHDFFEFFRLFFFFLWTSNFGKPHDRVLKKIIFHAYWIYYLHILILWDTFFWQWDTKKQPYFFMLLNILQFTYVC